jgi:hypothetical protein
MVCLAPKLPVSREPRKDPRSRATIKEVAAEVGVSAATVSNAYNRPDQLTSELRERVFEAARRLGYSGPDPVARGLRRGRSGPVGVACWSRSSMARTRGVPSPCRPDSSSAARPLRRRRTANSGESVLLDDHCLVGTQVDLSVHLLAVAVEVGREREAAPDLRSVVVEG